MRLQRSTIAITSPPPSMSPLTIASENDECFSLAEAEAIEVLMTEPNSPTSTILDVVVTTSSQGKQSRVAAPSLLICLDCQVNSELTQDDEARMRQAPAPRSNVDQPTSGSIDMEWSDDESEEDPVGLVYLDGLCLDGLCEGRDTASSMNGQQDQSNSSGKV